MARSIASIQQSIISNLVTTAAAVGVVIDAATWSMYDFRQMFTFVVAAAIGIFEQDYDQFLADTEAQALTLPPQTPPWFQNFVLNIFEYDATAVPIVQLNPVTLVPYYPNPNPLYRIIKYCSAVPGPLGTTLIKVATAGPTAVDPTPLSALQSALNQITMPGPTINAVTGDADRLYAAAQIFYTGLYSAVIEATVIAAITNYLTNIPFNGFVILSDLEAAIKAVPGVNDIVFNNVRARDAGTAFGDATGLVVSNTTVLRNWSTVAGYIIPETVAGHTLAESLTFIPQ